MAGRHKGKKSAEILKQGEIRCVRVGLFQTRRKILVGTPQHSPLGPMPAAEKNFMSSRNSKNMNTVVEKQQNIGYHRK